MKSDESKCNKLVQSNYVQYVSISPSFYLSISFFLSLTFLLCLYHCKKSGYPKDIEHLNHAFVYFRYLSITCNAFIACFIRRQKYLLGNYQKSSSGNHVTFKVASIFLVVHITYSMPPMLQISYFGRSDQNLHHRSDNYIIIPRKCRSKE